MGEGHRARVKGGDLIVGQIGGDEGLGGVGLRQQPDAADVDPQARKPVETGLAVEPDGGQDRRFAAEGLERVRDVGGTPPELALQARRQECNVQHVDTIRKDVILELTVEHHDGVVGDRTAYQDALGRHRDSRSETWDRAAGGKLGIRGRRA
jgi:hypothetical protein